jgi:hypothetical protein
MPRRRKFSLREKINLASIVWRNRCSSPGSSPSLKALARARKLYFFGIRSRYLYLACNTFVLFFCWLSFGFTLLRRILAGHLHAAGVLLLYVLVLQYYYYCKRTNTAHTDGTHGCMCFSCHKIYANTTGYGDRPIIVHFRRHITVRISLMKRPYPTLLVVHNASLHKPGSTRYHTVRQGNIQ